MDYTEARETLEREAVALGLFIDCQFVPQSKSRNANDKNPTLNWLVSLYINRGRVASGSGAQRSVDVLVWRGDYSQGIAHLKNYNQSCTFNYWRSIHGSERLKRIVETGKDAELVTAPDVKCFVEEPTLADILSSLLLDASAIDEGSFEDWASSLGYDPDSRKVEAIWKECVTTGLKLRAALGDETLRRFQELAGEM